MVKKKSKKTTVSESAVTPILEINYKDPLFSLAAHPTEPIIVSGLATGHLYCSRYDGEKLEENAQKNRDRISKREGFTPGVSEAKEKWWSVVDDLSESAEDSGIVTSWKTKRHKGSCRSVIFEPFAETAGKNLYSVGTDHVIKKAATETGKVVSKTCASDNFTTEKDAITKLAHSTTHPFLLAGTENGHVLVYDSSNLTSKLKFKVDLAHEDAINDILPMPDVSAYHYLTLGSTTLSHLDIRKGIVTQSDDQEDELLSMCFASDHVNGHKNDTVLVGHGEGIITIWKNSKNKLMDQLSRIKVNTNASIDAIISTMQCHNDDVNDSVWCGDSDGYLSRVNYKQGKLVERRVHSSVRGKHGAIDEVGNLDIDYQYRLISAGMDSLRIWGREGDEKNDEENDEESDDSDSESDSDSDDGFGSDGFSDGSLGSLLSEDEKEQDEEEKNSEGDEEKNSEDDEEDENDGEENEEDDEEEDEQEVASAPLNIVSKKRFQPKPEKQEKQTQKKQKVNQPPSVKSGIRRFDDL